ncbi:protein of unknown function [Flavobacterium segetis]|uniref:DUF5071 domain-containing protein n=1 Tax=Flavobacterium segetis TaxID=271157 RepID=A0A1M5EN62_9FLAO|nr:DUF5071 domain-containing protein [Flavobacterium segetis]SHF80669.1 protein of unknown function [Flavobacterium segetis]
MRNELQNIFDLIPKEKGDYKRAKNLKNYNVAELKPIIPNLLEWIQDMNWPISGIVAEYLVDNFIEIENEIYPILITVDHIWKWNVINIFKDLIVDEKNIEIIKRIAKNPTEMEKSEELDLLCKEVVEKRKW